MDAMLSLVPPKYLAMFAIICAIVKGLQLVMAAIISAGFASPLMLKIKAGLDDIAINLPTSPFKTPPIVGSTIKLFLICAVAVTLSACAGVTAETVESDVVDCAKTDVTPSTLAALLSALTGPAGAVTAGIEAAGVGGDVVYCAVEELVSQEEAKLSTAQAVPAAFTAVSASSLPNLVLIVRGEQYLQGLHVSGSKIVHRRMR